MIRSPTQTAQTASGLSLEYLQQGPENKDPLVFLHGYTDSCRSFTRLFATLPDDMNAIAVSLRGHGGSDRPQGAYDLATMASDVAGLIDCFGYERITVVGHCMGGFVAQRLALDFPERLDRLILIDSFATMAGNADVEALALDVAEFADGPVDANFVRAFQEGTIAKAVPREFIDMIVAESVKLPGWGWRTVLDALRQEDLTAELPKIIAPALLICGEEDVLFGRAYQRALLAGLPDASLSMLPGIGHSPHWEEPEAVAQLIAGFTGHSSATVTFQTARS